VEELDKELNFNKRLYLRWYI